MSLKVKRVSLSEQVVQLLQHFITDNGLHPGDELPTEMELTEIFGVSRTVVREGISAVSALGIIETETGRRPRVAELSNEVLNLFFANALRLDTEAVTELLEVREALETFAVRRAAERCSAEDIAVLEEHLKAMEIAVAGKDNLAFINADVEFHRLIAQTSGNKILLYLIEALRDATKESIAQGLDAHRTTTGLAWVQALHREIFSTLNANDPLGAAEAMERHFQDAIATLLARDRTTDGSAR